MVYYTEFSWMDNSELSSFVLSVSGGAGKTKETIELSWLVKLLLDCHHPLFFYYFSFFFFKKKVLHKTIYPTLKMCGTLFQHLQGV